MQQFLILLEGLIGKHAFQKTYEDFSTPVILDNKKTFLVKTEAAEQALNFDTTKKGETCHPMRHW